MKRYAVYSGSFNPLHKGHLAIAGYLSGAFDGVYLIVSPQSPLRDDIGCDSASERFRAAMEAATRHPELNVTVSDIELRLPPPHYTIRTLDLLAAERPDASFTLAIGADQLADLRRWKDYDRILLEYGVIAFPRQGVELKAVAADLMAENPAYRIELTGTPLVDVSSTRIRELLAFGGDVSELLW